MYFDEVIITGSYNDEVIALVNQLNAELSLKDLRDLNYFLGIEVAKTIDGINLSQKKYILEPLKRAKLDQANSAYLYDHDLHLFSKQGTLIENCSGI